MSTATFNTGGAGDVSLDLSEVIASATFGSAGAGSVDLNVSDFGVAEFNTGTSGSVELDLLNPGAAAFGVTPAGSAILELVNPGEVDLSAFPAGSVALELIDSVSTNFSATPAGSVVFEIENPSTPPASTAWTTGVGCSATSISQETLASGLYKSIFGLSTPVGVGGFEVALLDASGAEITDSAYVRRSVSAGSGAWGPFTTTKTCDGVDIAFAGVENLGTIAFQALNADTVVGGVAVFGGSGERVFTVMLQDVRSYVAGDTPSIQPGGLRTGVEYIQ